MKATIKNYSFKNKGILLKTDKMEQWYSVPEEMQSIFETTKKEQEVDFSYEKKEQEGRTSFVLKTFKPIVPEGATTNFVAGNTYKKDQETRTDLILKQVSYKVSVEFIKSLKNMDDTNAFDLLKSYSRKIYKDLKGDW